MSSTLVTTTALLYALGWSLGLVFLLRGEDRWSATARACLIGGLLLHAVSLLAHGLSIGAGTSGMQRALSLLSWLSVAGTLVAVARDDLRSLGAFVVPMALLFLLGSMWPGAAAPSPPHVRSLLLNLHVVCNSLGIGAFASACALSIAYVVQESLLRRKKLSGAAQRLPALDALDRWALRLVVLGLPLLALGIVTGALRARQVELDGRGLTPAQAFALIAWVVFASVVLLRLVAGWRGRRAAIGTILGFLCTMVVVIGYLYRSTAGS